MNELARLAIELVKARDAADPGEWECVGHEVVSGSESIILGPDMDGADIHFICEAANHAVDIIKGYQDLVRRVVDAYWNESESFDHLIDDLEDSISEERKYE